MGLQKVRHDLVIKQQSITFSGEVQMLSPEIRSKTRMSILMTSFPHFTGGPSQGNWARKTGIHTGSKDLIPDLSDSQTHTFLLWSDLSKYNLLLIKSTLLKLLFDEFGQIIPV